MKDESVSITADAKTLQLLIGTPLDSASVYFVTLINGQWREFKRLPLAKGYHSVTVDCSDLLEGQANQVRLISISNFKTSCETVDINIKANKTLQIIGESFRDKLTAGQTETWNIRLVNGDGTPAQGALVLDMFNQALSALKAHSLAFNPISLYTPNNFRLSFIYNNYNRLQLLVAKNQYLQYGISIASSLQFLRLVGRCKRRHLYSWFSKNGICQS